MRKSVVVIAFVMGFMVVAGLVYVIQWDNANRQRIQMVEAVERQDLKAVKRLVDSSPSLVNAERILDYTPSGQPVLISAIADKNKAISEFLIRRGADVNCRGDGAETPLHYAARWGDVDIATRLLDAGADPNSKDMSKPPITPLMCAVYEGNQEVASLLMSRGAKRGSRIHEAAAFGDLKTVRTEVQRDAGLINTKEYFVRPLDLAAKHGRIGVVQYLISAGAAVSPPALLYAAQSGQLAVVKILLANGADVSGKGDDLAYTPLHGAAEAGQMAVVKYLLSHGADPSIKSQGYTPAELAAESGHPQVVRIIDEFAPAGATHR